MSIRIIAALFIRQAYSITRTAEIRIANAHHADNAILRAVTSSNSERTRTLLFDIKFHNHGIWVHTRIHFDIDIFKETEIIDTLHTAARLLGIEWLTGFLPHLT